MEKQEAIDLIYDYRKDIDEIDRRLVGLLNERAGLSIKIRKLKPAADMQLYDASREDAIYEKVCKLSEGTLKDEGLKEIYATLLKVMKENPAE